MKTFNQQKPEPTLKWVFIKVCTCEFIVHCSVRRATESWGRGQEGRHRTGHGNEVKRLKKINSLLCTYSKKLRQVNQRAYFRSDLMNTRPEFEIDLRFFLMFPRQVMIILHLINFRWLAWKDKVWDVSKATGKSPHASCPYVPHFSFTLQNNPVFAIISPILFSWC